MSNLVIETLIKGVTTLESKIQVDDLHEATMALGADLMNTADPTWSAEVMAEWGKHPGSCEMPDGDDVTWIFRYEDEV